MQPQALAKERFGVRALVNIGMLAAIAIILMLLIFRFLCTVVL